MANNTASPQSIAKSIDELDLRKWMSVILQHRKLGISVAIVVLAFGWFRLFMAQPIYQADALLQIGQQQSSVLGLPEMGTSGGGYYYEGQPEIEVIRSRSVLRRVVEDLRLEINAQPRRFPYFGAAFSRHGLGKPFQWLGSKYAWGDERIEIDQFDFPKSLAGSTFILRAGNKGQYILYGANNKPLLSGEVGKTAVVNLADGPMTLLVHEMSARPGVEFFVYNASIDSAVAGLQGSLDVSMKNKQKSLIQLVMTGPDPVRITKVLNGVARAYIQQNVEVHSEQASKSLDFLREQLPEIQQQLTTSEQALQAYKSKKGSVVDLSVEGKSALDQATMVESKMSDLRMQRSELKLRFTDASPAIRTIDQQLGQLAAMRENVDGQLKKMPQTELETIRLMRDVQVTNELYTRLLNRSQEFKVAKAGTVGDARIIDAAIQPTYSAYPNVAKAQLVSFLLAIFAGLGAIAIKVAFRRTLEMPDAIESELGLPVFATIPHSDAERKAQRTPKQGHVLELLCRTAPDDSAIEGLRSLRTSLQFAALEAKNNIVAIHGPTPGIGKSFVATNLAFLISDTDKSTLLIDADMRQGHIHKTLSQQRAPGLSDVISGSVKLSDAAHAFEKGKIAFLSTGSLPPNPSELLSHGHFQALLQHASKTFDYVVIDTPPTLNLADSISIGKQAGINFLVVRGGVSTIHDVRISQRRLEQNGIRIDGVIFNDLSVAAAKYGYGGYYSYKYKTATAE